jgi:thiol-disulfide isomerase/thioredoxin
MTEDGYGAVWCPWCRRELPHLDPWTMEPAAPDYDGNVLIVHDDVYHPANLEERPN